ncbi:DUF2167 domain-containing protein [Flavobacterium sp.]|uniref:DUF2167 domain-containing protein n=1 Tax=Flavobacterium sp. TaxID=239 RepID=UPI0028BD30CA|nr:DUF2167 domain-containing protein [Flavobacterium sp.]
MKKILLSLLVCLTILTKVNSQNTDSLKVVFDEIEKSLKYQTGKIELTEGNANLNVPKGFKFLDGKQTQYVLKDLWGNPEDTTILGAILPENKGVLGDNSWLFVINYQNEGYVEDGDAKDINYDDLLKEIQSDLEKENSEREKNGFEAVQLLGWASTPFYDEKTNVLHWAKEIKFGKAETNTLNYDLRILGRKGFYTVSAVSNMSELAEVKASIPSILKSVQYKDGFKYSEFDSNTDEIAAWTIGGLVAGKVLAKTGFIALLAKFGKFIVIGLIAAFAGLKKFIFPNKDQQTRKVSDSVANQETNPTKTEE